MPIPKHLRHFYRGDWVRVIRPAILKRAGWQCERCGKPDRAMVWTLPGGIWWDELLHHKIEGPDARIDETRRCWRMPGDAHLVLEPGDPWRNAIAPGDRGVFLTRGPHMDVRMDIAYYGDPADKFQDILEPKLITVVLTVAHVNHVSGDDRPENLAAWCQYCHLVWDVQHHRRTRGRRKDRARPLFAPLFDAAA